MSSTYSPSLRTELPATGDQNNAWATTVDNNLSVPLEQGITNSQTIAMPDANYTLTVGNAVADEARNPVLIFTGALTADRVVTAPSVPKIYIVKNSTTGGKNIVLKTAATPTPATITDTGYPFPFGAISFSGSTSSTLTVAGVSIPPNVTTVVICDGVNFDFAITSSGSVLSAASITLTNPLAPASGGTGANSGPGALTYLQAGTAATLDASAVNVASTAVARDALGNLEATTVTAGLQGTAATASNTLQLGSLPPPSFSGVDTNWSWQQTFSGSVTGPTSADIMALGGPGLYKYNLTGGVGPSSTVQYFYAVPSGTGAGQTAQIGQFLYVSQFFIADNFVKLGKDV